MREPSRSPAGRRRHLVPSRRPPGRLARPRSAAARRNSPAGGWRHQHGADLTAFCIATGIPTRRCPPRNRQWRQRRRACPGRSIRWRGGASAQSTTNPTRAMNRRHCGRYHCRVPHRFRLLGRMTWDGRDPAKPSPCGLFPHPRPPHAPGRVGTPSLRAPRGRFAANKPPAPVLRCRSGLPVRRLSTAVRFQATGAE